MIATHLVACVGVKCDGLFRPASLLTGVGHGDQTPVTLGVHPTVAIIGVSSVHSPINPQAGKARRLPAHIAHTFEVVCQQCKGVSGHARAHESRDLAPEECVLAC